MSVTDLRRQAADLAGGTSRRERNELYNYILRAITASAELGITEDALVQAVLGTATPDVPTNRAAVLARAAVRVVIADGAHLPTHTESI